MVATPGALRTMFVLALGFLGGSVLIALSGGLTAGRIFGLILGTVSGLLAVLALYRLWPRYWHDAAGWRGADRAAATWREKEIADARWGLPILGATALFCGGGIVVLNWLSDQIDDKIVLLVILTGVGGLCLGLWLLWRWLLGQAAQRSQVGYKGPTG